MTSMEVDGTQNIGGYGNTAGRLQNSKFDWFTQKMFQNEITNVKKVVAKPRSTDPYYYTIPKDPHRFINSL